jgi:hypothetical protein
MSPRKSIAPKNRIGFAEFWRAGRIALMVPLPQFSTRLLLVIMASCSVAFAMWAWRPHVLVVLAASTIPVFWVGVGCLFFAAVLVARGDSWSFPSALLDVVGAVLCLISIFGLVFFLFMLTLTGMIRLLSITATG